MNGKRITGRGNVSGRGNVETQNFASLYPPTTKTSERGHGYYFITLMVKNRECNLGKIVQIDDGASIILSDIKLVNWHKNIGLKHRNISHL